MTTQICSYIFTLVVLVCSHQRKTYIFLTPLNQIHTHYTLAYYRINVKFMLSNQIDEAMSIGHSWRWIKRHSCSLTYNSICSVSTTNKQIYVSLCWVTLYFVHQWIAESKVNVDKAIIVGCVFTLKKEVE